MRRLPVVPTIVVALAAAAMVALGLWQLLVRLPEKQAFLAQLAANPARPAIAFPDPPVGETLLFRRANATCPGPIAFSVEGAGSAGFRVVAHCGSGTDGPGIAVQIGTTRDPQVRPRWAGGRVSGIISHAPSHDALIMRLFGRTPPAALLLVADAPAPGLAANAPPSVDAIPNNHLAYAVQWFVFAGLAVIIYGLALRRRPRGA